MTVLLILSAVVFFAALSAGGFFMCLMIWESGNRN